MAKIVQRNEILYRAPARVGLLADVTERFLARNVNILGIRAYEENGDGVFLIYADDSRAASEAIKNMNEGEMRIVPVISALLPNRPGELNALATALANANINITQVHATGAAGADTEVILTTDDNVRAIDVLMTLKV